MGVAGAKLLLLPCSPEHEQLYQQPRASSLQHPAMPPRPAQLGGCGTWVPIPALLSLLSAQQLPCKQGMGRQHPPMLQKERKKGAEETMQ